MRPGAVIGGRFTIVERVRAGGMGTVFRAEDRVTNRQVALKLLHGDDRTDVERFVREAAILAELEHPNIVRYVGHGLDEEGGHYLAMEWLEGEDLAARIARRRLSDLETLTVVKQAIDALSFAHARGAVHRDVKPSNIFLRDRSVDRVVLVDFGVAGIAGEDRRLTEAGMLLGTPGYMAPEQVEGTPTQDPRSDIFSLGCVIFECLTGQPAFEGANPMAVLAKLLLQESPRLAALRPEIPEIDRVLTRMLAKNPAERPASLAEVAAELEALPSSFGVRTPRSPAVPADLYETLHSADLGADGQVALGRGENRLVTVVLAGDPGPGTLVRTLPAQSVGELAAAIEPFGGHLAPLAGGAMVVTTWTPGTALERAERASLCALALHERYPSMPITIVTGRGLVAARVVEGAVIDRAARALLATRAGAVSLDDGTADLLPPRFRVERSGDGFELCGAVAAHEGVPLLLGKPTPCLGRNRELAMLEGIFSGCVAEPVASAALVIGSAGAGKSRLRRELVDRLRRGEEPIEVLAGRADALGAGTPFGVIADVIRSASGIREGEPIEARRRKLSARLARTVQAAQLGRVASFLGELISAPFPDDGDPVLVAARDNALLMGDAMRAAWEEWLIAECNVHPVLLVLEDLQWGDGATARLVDSTLRNLRDLPLMVLVLARPEAQNDLLGAWTRRDVPVIRLGPLPTRACDRLVREVLPAVSDEVARQIVDRSAGNPFYLEELIRAVAAGRGDVLPDSVAGTVEARLDAEGSEAKRVLRAASVFGDRFWVGGVCALLGGERLEGEARRMLGSLAARELIAPVGASETEYVFCHTLVREAAYAMLPASDQALGHRLAGDWLERTGHTDSMALAEHFRRADEPARAVRWYRRAAEQALEANDLGAALSRCELAERAGAAGAELGALRLVQAEAHVWRSELDAAEARGHEAMALVEPGSTPWFRAAHQVVNAAAKLGAIDRVERIVEQALAVTPAPSARRAQIAALGEGACWIAISGNYAAAEQRMSAIDAIVAADPAALDAQLRALLHQMRATKALVEGDLGAARERFAAALSSFEAASDQRNATTMRSNLGSIVADLGDFEGAETALRAALASAERLGLTDSATFALANLGHILAYRDNLPEARLVEQRAVESLHRAGDARLEGVARTYLAKVALFSGDLEGAARTARQAVDLLQIAPPLQPAARAVEARALLGLGETEAAFAAAREAYTTLEALGALEEGETAVRLVHAESLAARGDDAGFRAAIRSARDTLLARADKIRDPAWRHRFLHAVPDNARTLALAAAVDEGSRD